MTILFFPNVLIRTTSFQIEGSCIILRHLRWCRAQDLFGPQILVTQFT